MEILFRGKREEDNKLIYGNYLYTFDIDYVSQGYDDVPDRVSYIINDFGKYDKVEPSTIGQYTNIKDINNDKIFVGDKVKYWRFYHDRGTTADWFGAEPQNSSVVYEEYMEQIEGVIEFIDGAYWIVNKHNPKYKVLLGSAMKGLGNEVSLFYMNDYGGDVSYFFECLDNEEQYNELMKLYNDNNMNEMFDLLEKYVEQLTNNIEIIGNIYEQI